MTTFKTFFVNIQTQMHHVTASETPHHGTY